MRIQKIETVELEKILSSRYRSMELTGETLATLRCLHALCGNNTVLCLTELITLARQGEISDAVADECWSAIICQ